MISKVGLENIHHVGFQGNTNILDKFRETLKTESANNNVNLSGNEALANYNKPIIKNDSNTLKPAENIESFIIKDFTEPIKLKGDEINTLGGERIFNDEGKLEAIIVKGDKTSKEYIVDTDANKITEIIERDNETGFANRIDYFGIKYNENSSGTVQEFIPHTNKLKKESNFNEEKLNFVKIFNDDKNIENYFESDGKLSWINVKDNKTGLTTHYVVNDAKQIKYADIEDENYNSLKEISYDKGKITEVIENKYRPIKNIYGITPDNIPLKPAVFVEAPEISKLNGEKKFNSDGTLKHVTTTDGNKKTEYIISYDGKRVKEIKEFNNEQKTKEIYFNEAGNTNIKEYKDGKIYKTTFYTKSKQPDCVMEYTADEKVSKIVDYYKDGTSIRKYMEEGNPQYGYINMCFDKDKQLTAVVIKNTETTTTKYDD